MTPAVVQALEALRDEMQRSAQRFEREALTSMVDKKGRDARQIRAWERRTFADKLDALLHGAGRGVERCINCGHAFSRYDVCGYWGAQNNQVGPFCERCYATIKKHETHGAGHLPKQEDLPADAAKVLREHAWELYEDEKKDDPAK